MGAKRNIFDGLSASERVSLAKERMNRIVDHMVHLINIRQSNEVILYSDTLSKQIPRSYGANAFNVFRDVSFRYEIVRLCAMWDKASLDRESLPTVGLLVNDREVRRILSCEAYSARAGILPRDLTPDPDPEMQEAIDRSIADYTERSARREARKTLRGLRRFVRDVEEIMSLESLDSLRAHRDTHMAHSLATAEVNVERMNRAKYGQERIIFDRTLEIVHAGQIWINGSDFQFDESVRMALRNAKLLWENCSFNVPKGRDH